MPQLDIVATAYARLMPMQLIVDGADITARLKTIEELFPKNKFLYEEITSDTSIKVEDIRRLVDKLSISKSQELLVLISQAEDLTIASQNTLLKILEEPPEKTSFALSLTNHRTLLPTIRSRCIIKHLTPQLKEANKELLKELKEIIKQKTAARLNTSSKLGKDRDKVLAYFEDLTNSLHTSLKETTNPKSQRFLADLAKQTMQTISQLKRNTNVTLARDNFFLKLPQIK